MKFVELTGVGGHKVLINVQHIRDVRVWPGPVASAVITDNETYLLQESVNQVKQKLLALGNVA